MTLADEPKQKLTSTSEEKRIEDVWIDSLDGFESEKLCSRILERIGYGRIEYVGKVGDEGRDFILHSDNGKIIAECKHQHKGIPGRPMKKYRKMYGLHLKRGSKDSLISLQAAWFFMCCL